MSYERELEALDNPFVTQFIFYPRKDFTQPPPNAADCFVNVEPGVYVHTRLYAVDKAAPTILYFHGNGEVVSDHDDIGPVYNRFGVNLLVADYRGYGASDGQPTFRAVFVDAHRVLEASTSKLQELGYCPSLFVMGRSLGSAPACELAASHPDRLRGLIIESGFASAARLLRYLGLPVEVPDRDDLPNLSNIRRITLPALIMHGEVDNLIPVSEARETYAKLSTEDKRLLIIEDAGHNDIMYVGGRDYFQAIADFVCGRVSGPGRESRQ